MEKGLDGCPSISVVLALPPTLNQSYKIVTIRGYSRLALSEEASEYKDEIAVLAFQALTKEFPVINGPGGGEYRLELVQHLSRNGKDTGFAPRSGRWPRSFSLGRCRRGIEVECRRCICVPDPSRVKGLRWIELGRGQLPALRI